MNQRTVDINGFREDIGLDEDALKELYFIFVEELKKELEEVNYYSGSGEVEKLRKAVHNIKGIASSYRTENVFVSAKDLDLRLKYQDLENLNPYVKDLNDKIIEAVNQINLYFKE